MTFDVVRAVVEGKGRYELAPVESSDPEGNRLRIFVFRDALKFDGIPRLRWDFTVAGAGEVYDGVRLPATAVQLQEIADLLGCLLLTPKVVDLIWLQAGLKFDPVCNLGPPTYRIAAVSDITAIHQLIEKRIEEAGGDDGTKLVDCVGKHWVLVNALGLRAELQGAEQCFNYGWPAKDAPHAGVSFGVKVWQPPGGVHNVWHRDPSQVIRLMYKWAKLRRAGSEDWEDVLLTEVLQDEALAHLAHHEGVLGALRQPGAEPLEELMMHMPVLEIEGSAPAVLALGGGVG